jgi:hypothetical protein
MIPPKRDVRSGFEARAMTVVGPHVAASVDGEGKAGRKDKLRCRGVGSSDAAWDVSVVVMPFLEAHA